MAQALIWESQNACGILFLKECNHDLESEKPTALIDLAWSNYICNKAITYIQMAVAYEILVNLKDYNITDEL